MNFLYNFNPQPILFKIGLIEIRWYGFLMALALVIGIFIFYKLATKKGIKPDQVYDLSYYLALFGIIGARLYEVLFINFSYYLNNPWAVFKIWQGGLAIHGSVIAGIIVLYVWTKKNKVNFWSLANLLVVPLILGQAIGRWGNYFNQELFGWPTNSFIGIPIDLAHRPVEFITATHFHPTFLYESILNLVLFFILLWIVRKGFKTNLATPVYFIGYGLIRFFMEFIRIDVTPEFWGLRLPQYASLVLIILGLSLIIYQKKRLLK